MKHLLTSIALALLLAACVTGERYMLDDGETVVLGDTVECMEGDCTDPTALDPLIDYADPEPTEEEIVDEDVVEEEGNGALSHLPQIGSTLNFDEIQIHQLPAHPVVGF